MKRVIHLEKAGFFALKLSELIMARYHPERDMIVGCKPDTFAWFHEQCHRLQHRSKLFCVAKDVTAKLYDFGATGAVFFGVSFAVYPSLSDWWISWLLFCIVFLLPRLVFVVTAEMDAHFYAARMKWQRRHGLFRNV